MADVRSLLRNERAQRRIEHPQASYSATGSLECSVCHISLKSDIEIWNKHLKSTQHAMRQERIRLSAPQRPKSTILPERVEERTRDPGAASKKRKADDGNGDSRKRTRPVVDVPGGLADENTNAEETNRPMVRGDAVTEPLEGFVRAIDAASSSNSAEAPTNPVVQTPIAPIDEDEWAAFERDVATPPPDPSVPSALTAAATISAAPMSAAELAADSREQAKLQGRENREMEVEEEKEDAARALEDEFDEMEGLEERVRRLRKKRDELRLQRTKEVEEGLEDDGKKGTEGKRADVSDEYEDSEDEEDDTGLGAWGR